MTGPRRPWYERPLAPTAALLALLAYLPALTAAPGRMPADSKLYLYLDPGRLLGDAAASFDPRQFAGWVPHQHIAYLWPSGPWFWVLDALGVPDWIAHRLWIGTLMVAAGLGVRWCARLLGVAPLAAAVAAIVYQVSVYVLPYVSRTSVMLLPWAGLGWIVALTIRATRRRSWGDPAAIALGVLTVGAVNATALAMIVPAPLLWLVHATWQRSIAWSDAALVAARTAVLSVGISLWWIVMLVVQGRYGADVLPYSESLADVSLTATSPEVWRGLGYWLFYVRDPYAATTTESLRYLSSTPAIAVSYLVPVTCLAGLVFVDWAHRRFAALLVVTGVVLAVGVHPVDDRSPLMRLVAGGDDRGLALALRSSTRALPLLMLGLALAAGALVTALRAGRIRRLELRADHAVAAVIGLVVVANLPGLWTGAFVDPALERDQDPPDAWRDAAAELDDPGARVLQLPGAEFGAYRWGYTVDQPLPGLAGQPLVTRDLLPLGSPAAMDLLYAFDDRVQDGTLEPEAVAAIARLLGVDTIWVTGDAAFDRFRTARPEVVARMVASAPGVGPARPEGGPVVNQPIIPMIDGRALSDPAVGRPIAPVVLHELDEPGRVVRAAPGSVLVSGSGDGLVDLAAAGLLGDGAVVRYSASLAGRELDDAIADAEGVLVTDANRDRARHWRSSRDTAGYTEPGGPAQDVLRPVASDQRLPVFDTADPTAQTIAIQRGPVTATATSYGEPFAYLPEHRPAMAVDGDPSTSWIVGEHGDPIGETLRLDFAEPVADLVVRQPTLRGQRRITEIVVRVRTEDGAVGPPEGMIRSLDDSSATEAGQRIPLGGRVVGADLTIREVGGGEPATAGAVAGVGFTEIDAGLGPTVEVVRPPHDALDRIGAGTPLTIALTRLRTDPLDRWRDDPEPELVRELDLPVGRSFDLGLTVRVDARTPDVTLARLFDWPAVASDRLIGSLRNVGIAAVDGDPDTAWITPFDGALGATLTIAGMAEPITEITVRQPIGPYATITGLVVASGDEEREVELSPDDDGASVAVDPPLPPGDVTIRIATVAPDALTIDRRHGDPVQLPAAISEITMDGLRPAPSADDARLEIACAPLLTVDGRTVHASLTITGEQMLDGRGVQAEPCEEALVLDAGSHVLAAARTDLPITLDRVVLDDGVSDESSRSVSPTVEVTDRSRFGRTIEVTDCPDGCWLVLGEGFSRAWAAETADGPLGPPDLVDGGFNGWWLEGATGTIEVDVRWTAQRPLTVALVLSALVAVVAIGLLLHDRRRAVAPPVERDEAPRLDGLAGRVPRDRAIAVAIVWAAGAGVLVGPWWAVGGAIGGIAIILTRRRRLAELTSWASVAAIGAAITFLERRDAPFPNGGWPATFESLHGIGVFAAASLLAAVVADDAALPLEDAPTES